LGDTLLVFRARKAGIETKTYETETSRMDLGTYEARCKRAVELAAALRKEMDGDNAAAEKQGRLGRADESFEDEWDGKKLDEAVHRSKDKTLIAAVRVEQRRRNQATSWIHSGNNPFQFYAHYFLPPFFWQLEQQLVQAKAALVDEKSRRGSDESSCGATVKGCRDEVEVLGEASDRCGVSLESGNKLLCSDQFAMKELKKDLARLSNDLGPGSDSPPRRKTGKRGSSKSRGSAPLYNMTEEKEFLSKLKAEYRDLELSGQ